MSLLTRISVPAPDSPEAEDIFSSALTTIFTDDAVNSWGAPGSSITYRSPRFGPILLQVPTHPDEEQGRKLFAHYLWNAGVVAADAIETASSGPLPRPEKNGGGDADHKYVSGEWDEQYWDVRGKNILEIGAATALPSLIAALCGASTCAITDHPLSPALTTGAIEENVKTNLCCVVSGSSSSSSKKIPDISASESRTTTKVNIYGFTWGTSTFYLPSSYGKVESPTSHSALPPNPPTTAHGYPCADKIIAADCLWMPSQHLNIIRSILDFLPPQPRVACTTSASSPCALVVAGFHTGRAIVRDFFAFATNHPSADQAALADAERALTGRLRLASIFETDTSGNRRDWIWDATREGEGKWEAKRWCVVGVLVRTGAEVECTSPTQAENGQAPAES